MRVVCKRWNALIHCSQFQEMCLTSLGAWGPVYAPQRLWKGRSSLVQPWSSYDLAERKWITMPDLSFPSQVGHRSWKLLAADGGLLCFRSLDERGILVCNPMTNKWKELPYVSVDTRAPVISHMIVDAQRSSYKILLAGHAKYELPHTRVTTNPLDLYIYNSVSKTWKAAEMLFANMVEFHSGAYCRDEFYILTLRTGVQTVVALDLTTHVEGPPHSSSRGFDLP